jgi:hypothetical protein
MAGQKKKVRYSEETLWFLKYYISWIGIGNCGQKTFNVNWLLFILGCHNLTLVGNGLCDDETNILECNFDDGDCCGSNITTTHCSECQCLEVIIPPSGTFFF